MRLIRVLCAAFVLLLVLHSPALAEFPAQTGRVTDAAGVLSADAEARALAEIQRVEASNGSELAVVTVTSLDGMTVEEYANRLFNQWGIGKKGSDNGVLLLVAPTEHKVRIEVGYGVEPILPDGLAGDVIRNQALPAFKNDDYERGILDALTRIGGIVVAGHVVTPEERQRWADAVASENLPPTWLITPFFGAFVGIGMFMLGLGIRAKAGFPVMFGSMFGGIPGLMALIPFFNVTWWALGPFAALMFFLGYRKGGVESWRKGVRGTGKGSRGTGWVSGGDSSSSSSSSWSSDSSSSSSSSSFGGGSSGGGGASGSW